MVFRSNKNFSFIHYISSFECGFSGSLSMFSNFSGSFLLLLVFFVLLDVEVVLLINSSLEESHIFNYLYYCTFLIVVLIGFFYEICSSLIKFN
uniref:NADH-ubiquinone oxidoreductase chain 3 n=1 Tax=Pseudochauhanea macrorchis TaxID=1086615 RepID=H6U4S0_PSEMH|nr:NADH dehydrogenase subunit 3 [Pseudochauhanea macrorchis]AEO93256.1 NADH dehydrogenase subunit 3 [Pseudochauhanea macrorchis]